MRHAYSALITNTCFLNAKNKITHNIFNFCNHGNQTMETSAIYKNDIFKPNYLLTAQVYMNYACIALITLVFLLNANNKITQNCYIFVTMAPKKWTPQQFDKNDIYKPKYVLTTNKYMIQVYVFLFCFVFVVLLSVVFLQNR